MPSSLEANGLVRRSEQPFELMQCGLAPTNTQGKKTRLTFLPCLFQQPNPLCVGPKTESLPFSSRWTAQGPSLSVTSVATT